MKTKKSGKLPVVIGLAAGGIAIAGVSAIIARVKQGYAWLFEDEGDCDDCGCFCSSCTVDCSNNCKKCADSEAKDAHVMFNAAKAAYDSAMKARDDAKKKVAHMEEVMALAQDDMKQAAKTITEQSSDPIPEMWTDTLKHPDDDGDVSVKGGE